MQIGPREVEAARERIGGHVRRTPVLELPADTFAAVPTPLALKLETLQHTGSFKVRGAFHRLLSAEIPRAGVVAASGGNHGAAVAFAARALGLPVRVFMPATAPPAKVARVRGYGAEVTLIGAGYDDAREAAAQYAATSGALDVPAFDDLAVIAGQGTVALEVADQARFDTLLVAVGGGGLAAGCAAALAGRGVRLVGVETTRTASLHAALAAGGPVEVDVSGVAADALGARRVGRLPFIVLDAAIDRVVLVEDEDVVATQRVLWEELRVVAEPGGAAALAALLRGAYRPAAGERIGIVICGANVHPGSVG
ncbi:MAG: serine/threonine dehydratase [Acidobacteria bacterium]|nr:serine/threonine dehydratase [Acidobacteriota bacterium]